MEMKNENEGTKVNETIPEEMSKPEENSEANKPADPVDRISSLPDQVAQLILSLLPEKDAARSTVWSKRWDRLHHSSPILDFDERRFQGAGYANCRRKFLYHIEKALLKRGNLTQVKELQVVSAMSFDDDLEEILMRLLGMAVRDKVPEIKLDINKNSHPRDDFTICFVLPEDLDDIVKLTCYI
ncbi:F-box/LRR-repeat protein At3g59200-like [Carica papaya]|uniref:F-box/LRR-repeat protein At3g59200-like n=1 Tax=Carica papaya TaxID=3649 RepID=UPI000B8D0F97|nr:F-box/LRR-repeat protein At3g59200-like [Carica papaya]